MVIVIHIWQKLSSVEHKVTLIVTDFWQLLSHIINIGPNRTVFPIQNLLNISLSEMAKVDPDKSMFIQPRFGRPRPTLHKEQLDLFVLMPFNPDMRRVYEDHIKNVAANLSLEVDRANDFFTAHVVMQDIWTAICRSRIIIADCTSRNPNVFYATAAIGCMKYL